MEASRHAAQRMSQRHISQNDLDAVMRFGREIHRAGALFIFLGYKDIPETLHWKGIERLVGTTILLSSDEECIITAYKNKEALRDIKRKDKRYMPRSGRLWH